MQPAPSADQAALARVGERVRARLATDPAVHEIETERAEIYAVGDFLSPLECEHFIGIIDRVARPSQVFDPQINDYRTSYSGDVERTDSFVRMIERRLTDLLGIDESWGETVQGQRYHPGQQFKGHCDWFDTLAAYWPAENSRGGQRCWTAMVYLNDVEEGGHTEFPRLGFSIAPQRGALLLWNNAAPDGSVNLDVTHAGLPVVSGVKYVITKWFRTRPWG